MQARMKNPAYLFPDALKNLRALAETGAGEVPGKTVAMVHLRASQINGCGICTDMHARELREAGETDERLWSIAAWREAPYYTDAERAALALTEAATRIADRPEAVSDEIWNEAAKHYGEKALAVLVLHIGMINMWNRINVTIRQPVVKVA
ncbi:MAG TPA: carboxymuconolactone decarboxylase family protein [Rhizomicrobium sp.]|nr:carboxymuconolactone decarboxylase family protein [Rhizomicrobium sp.]